MVKFKKKIAKPCTVIINENDMIAAIKVLETHKLSRNIDIMTCSERDSSAKEFSIAFVTVCEKWQAVGVDLKAKCQSTVFTEITDQFGKIHYIELA